jgi:uncharacterized protein YjbI with pentapeptide repeats
VRISREGQVTERFTRAVDQLGSEHLDVRLGGLYALERIARDSPGDRRTIAEVLTAYIRQRAPWPPTQPGQYRADWPLRQQLDLRTRAPDVQSALTVLGRGPYPKPASHEAASAHRLDLREVDLRKADLDSANLAGAWLDSANLAGAWLGEANLQRVWLRRANLQRADFVKANLQRAWLGEANLQGAGLVKANLQVAHLYGANLQGARLGGANLQWARLTSANVQAAYLDEANLQGVWLGGADLRGARLAGANLQGAWLVGADLRGARLGGANLRGANLQRARLAGANLRGAWLGGANLREAHLYGANLQGARETTTTVWPLEFPWREAGVIEIHRSGVPPPTEDQAVADVAARSVEPGPAELSEHEDHPSEAEQSGPDGDSQQARARHDD